MTTHRKSSPKPASPRVALRVNGKPVVNGAGAKLAAAALGYLQTTGSQCGQGNARVMLTEIGRGNIAQFKINIDEVETLGIMSCEFDMLAGKQLSDDYGKVVAELLRATAAALRNAAGLREAQYRKEKSK